MAGGVIVRIDCIWDNEANVWIAKSKDVKGLVLEDGSLDRLMYRVKEAVPELIQLNNLPRCAEVMFRAKKKEVAFSGVKKVPVTLSVKVPVTLSKNLQS